MAYDGDGDGDRALSDLEGVRVGVVEAGSRVAGAAGWSLAGASSIQSLRSRGLKVCSCVCGRGARNAARHKEVLVLWLRHNAHNLHRQRGTIKAPTS